MIHAALWIIAFIIVAYAVYFVGMLILAGIGTAVDAVTPTKTPNFTFKAPEDGLSELGNSPNTLNSSSDKEEFKALTDEYYAQMKALLESDNTDAADQLARSLFDYSNLNTYLRIIADYRYAYTDSLKKILGSKNVKINHNKDILLIGTVKITMESVHGTSYSGEDEYSREIEVHAGTAKVLDITMRGEMYEPSGDYFISVFKPKAWVFDVLELGETFQAAIPQEKQERARKNSQDRYL